MRQSVHDIEAIDAELLPVLDYILTPINKATSVAFREN